MSRHEYIVIRANSPDPVCKECGEKIADGSCYEFRDCRFFCGRCFRHRYLQKNWITMVCDQCREVVNTFFDLGDEILCEECCDRLYKREIAEA